MHMAPLSLLPDNMEPLYHIFLQSNLPNSNSYFFSLLLATITYIAIIVIDHYYFLSDHVLRYKIAYQ